MLSSLRDGDSQPRRCRVKDWRGYWIDAVHDRRQPVAMTLDMDSCVEIPTGLYRPVYSALTAVDG